jgi:uncharacterized protein YehS (DUF1456 family)
MEVLEQLFYVSTMNNQYKQVPAIVNFKLDEIQSILKNRKSTGTQKIYNNAMVKMIDGFVKNPMLFKKTKALQIPDGSPIGSY